MEDAGLEQGAPAALFRKAAEQAADGKVDGIHIQIISVGRDFGKTAALGRQGRRI